MSSPRNHTYSKRSKPPSAHHGAYWWCEQTNLGLFAEPYDRVPLLHSIRFGIQHLSLTQPHFLAGLRSQLQATGITDTLIPHVQEKLMEVTVKMRYLWPVQPLLCQRGKLLIIQEAQVVTRNLHKAVCSFMSAASLFSTQRCNLPWSLEWLLWLQVWLPWPGWSILFVCLSNMYHSRRYCYVKYSF